MDTYYDASNDMERDVQNSQSSESSNSSGTSQESREEVKFLEKYVLMCSVLRGFVRISVVAENESWHT
jgi:hypothetical protein